MKIQNHKRFGLFIITVILSIVTIITVSATMLDKHQPKSVIHMVRSGETLWSIAKEYCPKNKDIRIYIFEMKKANNLKSNIIYEGDVLDIIRP